MNILSSESSRPGPNRSPIKAPPSENPPSPSPPEDEFRLSPVLRGVLSGAVYGLSTSMSTRLTGVIPISGLVGGAVAPTLLALNGYTGADDLLGAATLGIPAGLIGGFLGAGLGPAGVVASTVLFGAASGLLSTEAL